MISCQHKKGNLSSSSNSDPVIRTDHPNPTADKPQSKLWYMYDSWWALLPRSSGPSLWQRTKKGWIEHTEISESLKGSPGQTDVWADNTEVTAVGVADHSLSVFRLMSSVKSGKISWKTRILTKLNPPSVNDFIETATIAADGTGRFWIAAAAGTKVCVWYTLDDYEKWSAPLILAQGIDEDDICVITPLNEGIGVIWSDQIREAVIIRIHKDDKPSDIWEPIEFIDFGNKTADDHLNSSLAPDGTLWIATKNSVDQVGKPQFVLRIRSSAGKWINLPYVNRENTNFPTRPIVIATQDNSLIMTGYTDSDRSIPFPHSSKIIFSIIDTSLSTVLDNPKVVISPASEHYSFINNVTGPRHPFPKNAPWTVLASDQNGNVYEANLKDLIFETND